MKRRGFNLIEMIVAVALLGIISLGLFVLLKAPLDVSLSSQKEFDVQSSMRVTTETVDKSLKNATSAFLLTKKDKKFKNEWNYFMVDEDGDKTRIILQEWTKSGFVTRVLAEAPKDEIKYTITFKKASKPGLLNFRVLAEDLKRNKPYDITSDLKVLNVNTIVDQSKMDYSLSPPEKAGNCLAFRSDVPNPSKDEEGYHHVSISFVLDTSGSMRWGVDGSDGVSYDKRRISILKTELKKFFQTLVEQDKAGIVDVRLYPFSTKVFEGNPDFKVGNKYGRFLNLAKESKSPDYFNKMVDAMKVGGGTNVGDGIRFAYHGMKQYEEEKRTGPLPTGITKGDDLRIKHYLFVLSDGRPTFFSYTGASTTLPPSAYYPTPFRGRGSSALYYVISDNPVDDNLVNYGGLGNDVSRDEAEVKYVELVGNLVKAYNSKNPNEDVAVTVVGFSSIAQDNAYCTRIGKSAGAEAGADGKYFKDCKSPEALQAVFKSFSESVVADTLWYISGPE